MASSPLMVIVAPSSEAAGASSTISVSESASVVALSEVDVLLPHDANNNVPKANKKIDFFILNSILLNNYNFIVNNDFSNEIDFGNKILFSKWICKCKSSSNSFSIENVTLYVVHPSAGGV